MSQAPLKCRQTGTREIYDELAALSWPDALLQGLKLDSGYHELNYRDASDPNRKPKGKPVRADDNQIQCQELWENGLNALDRLGEMAEWEEDPAQAKDTRQKQAIESYQKLRRLIEGAVRRPIPWVLEAPHYGVTSKTKTQKLKAAQKIRDKVNKAIKKLNDLSDKEKLDPLQRQKCLIACLYWFVLVSEDGMGIPPGFESLLKRQGIHIDAIQRIETGFSEYLQGDGGGLGLIEIGQNGNEDEKSDADLEATAVDTILKRKGWCTEQSKVMYAVLRMARIEAFFVEPSLSVEYKIAKAKPEEKEKLKRLTKTPLLSHMASGVAVKIRDENDKESVWIIDVTSRLLEADYIQDNPGQWEARPHWELSLRHFYMADLANLGRDQTNHERYTAAEQNFEMTLQLGEDSTAFHAMGNYAQLLSLEAKQLSCRPKDKRRICKDKYNGIDKYSKGAVNINPANAAFQFSRGKYLLFRQALSEAVEAFFQTIDADPRFILPYQKLKKVIYDILEYGPKEFSDVWNVFMREMSATVERHPLLKEVIINGLEEGMKPKIPPEKLSRKDKKVIELVEELKKKSKL